MIQFNLVRAVLAGCGMLALSGQVLASDCTTSEEGTSIGTVGGSASCAAWGMVGCSISAWDSNGVGSCQYPDTKDNPSTVFTVYALKSLSSGATVQWTAVGNSEDFAGVDLAIWEGTKQGQN